jgi:hypothetical protein
MSRPLRRARSARPSALTRAARARAALAGAAVAALLAGCGGDDSPADSAADSAGSSTSAAAEGTSAASGDFCTQAATLDERVDAALSDLPDDDPSVADAFRQLSTELRGLEPPEAISADWEALSSGLDRMAQAFADLDLTDPDSLAGLDAAEGELSTASSNVEGYLRDECGIDP